jgi:sugar O-acyltransferase (sialic acid O-acetyltransferase NeuD family)
MNSIIIYGNGEFAKLMHHYFKTDSNYNVVAFCADREYVEDKLLNNLPLIPLDNLPSLYPPTKYKIFVAIGYSKMRSRVTMFQKIQNLNYSFVNYISTTAIVDISASLGINNAIFANVVIEPFVTIGDNNIIWSSSTICHNVTIKNHSFISAGSTVGGNSIIHDNVFIGFNSTIIQNIELKSETLLGAKSLLLKSTQKESKYIGTPAKKVSTHKNGIEIL